MNELEWIAHAKGLLKAEIARRNLNYRQVSKKLSEIGVDESPSMIRSKISRGKFSAIFFLQVLTAIGCDTLLIGKKVEDV